MKRLKYLSLVSACSCLFVAGANAADAIDATAVDSAVVVGEPVVTENAATVVVDVTISETYGTVTDADGRVVPASVPDGGYSR